jgi:uncharacterized membrane protein YvlD (DUF360 family)
MSFVVRTVLNALALWVTVQLIDGLAFEGGVLALLLVAAGVGSPTRERRSGAPRAEEKEGP